MKRYLPFVIILLVALLTAAGGTLLYRSKQQNATARANSSAGESGALSPHIRGPEDASITLEEFGDFQCPPCGNLFLVLQVLERDYGKQLRVIFREFPLAVHEHAMDAARAAEAAGLQGHFWEMHDVLYREQAAWSHTADARGAFEQYARALGLDMERFRQDLNNPSIEKRIAADHARGASLGVDRTPTVFLNQHLVPPPSFSLEGLRGLIEAARKK